VSDCNGSVAVCECMLRRPVCVVAEMLASRGFVVQGSADEDSRLLKVTSLPDMKFEITVTDDGYVQWEYWPRTGYRADPVTVAGLVARVLAADLGGTARPDSAGGIPAADPLGVIGRLLEVPGLRVWHVPWDNGAQEIVVVSTAAPGLGEVHVADDGSLMCEYPGQVSGAEVRAITDAVASMLAAAGDVTR
jgi:hypothetical protein